ncbi:hypothetical protein Misp01_66780 [Microtetraspora sp. NBRC 13810]|nr:hypothetical protein Misp01_66780 [Microtetraspora sp. NBRC 13810]
MVLVAICVALAGTTVLSSPAQAAYRPIVKTGAAVGVNSDGRLEAFVTSDVGVIWHIWQNPGGGWSEWDNLRMPSGAGAFGPKRPAVARNKDGRLEVFAVADNGHLYHIWQNPGGGWSNWESLGSGFGWANVAVAGNKDGRLEVFAVRDGQLVHRWQNPGGGWSGWANLGGSLHAETWPVVGVNADGRLELFVIGTNGRLSRNFQLAVNGTSGWSGWYSMGGDLVTGANEGPAVGRNADGRLEVFANSTDGTLRHIWQTSPNGGWSGWGTVGEGAGFPIVGRNADGRLEIVAVEGRAVVHNYQTNGRWSGWSNVGSVLAAMNRPAIASNPDGRLEIFQQHIVDGRSEIHHIYQVAPNSGWSNWSHLEAG